MSSASPGAVALKVDWPGAGAELSGSFTILVTSTMPSDLPRERVQVVLVSPRNPLNIGAAARAMANFGFTRLAVVAPHAPHWREARSAVGAPKLLQDAREFPTLGEAVAESALVLGTASAGRRSPEQPVVSLPDLAPLVAAEFARGSRIALVFGPEKRGLTHEDLSHCHRLVQIPTGARQPSMNLGQAVAVCLYELASRGFPQDAQKELDGCFDLERPAPSEMLDRLAEVIGETMLASDYSPRIMQAANRHDLRLLLRRLNLKQADVRRILGLFRRILWRLRHPVR